MEGLIMTAQILLSLSILVAVHEMGHLLAAKYFGMRVEEFSIGFPPKIFKFKKGETEYALSAIPLGGYVKISGMIDESLDTEKLKQDPEPWEFRSKPAWQRLIVMLGGIFVNVVVGVLIFISLTYLMGDAYISKDEVNNKGGIHALELGQQIGLQTGDKIIRINGQDFDDFQQIFNPDVLLSSNAYYTVDRKGAIIDIPIPGNFIEYFNDKETAGKFIFMRFPAVIGQVLPGSMAERLGLQAGDRFVEVDGQAVNFHDEVAALVKAEKRDSISFIIAREGELLTFNEAFESEQLIGYAPQAPDLKEAAIDYGLGESIVLGTERAFGIVFLQLKAFSKIFRGELSLKKSLAGPIGIAQAYGGNWDWQRFWRMTGLLSMVLAFMNLLPIPALDGGHVMFLSFEMLSGRKPSDKFLEVAQKAGMIFLLTLMVFIFANDIMRLFA
ncbi:MAG TPA: RIP metalloprotease RseP [Cyclobacteriaceae bacterium]|nr:RIP metalloprotease RseP [Cyclobacteriaceae bacterium]